MLKRPVAGKPAREIRQALVVGVRDDGTFDLLGESGDSYHADVVFGIVPPSAIWGSTRTFVADTRARHGRF